LIEPFYTYKAEFVDNYDGDTVTMDIDLGLNVWVRDQKLRLYGIDTPELRGSDREFGLEVRDYVKSRLEGAETILVETHKDSTGKYGRWLATIYADGINLNEELVLMDFAKVYP